MRHIYFHAEMKIGGRVICRMDASAIDNFYTGIEAKISIDPKNALLFRNEGERIITKLEV